MAKEKNKEQPPKEVEKINATTLEGQLDAYQRAEDGKSYSVWAVIQKERESLLGFVHNINREDGDYIFSFFNPRRKFPDVINWEFTSQQLMDMMTLINKATAWVAPATPAKPEEETEDTPDIPRKE